MTGSDLILSNQDWTRTEKFFSPLISAMGVLNHCGGAKLLRELPKSPAMSEVFSSVE